MSETVKVVCSRCKGTGEVRVRDVVTYAEPTTEVYGCNACAASGCITGKLVPGELERLRTLTPREAAAVEGDERLDAMLAEAGWTEPERDRDGCWSSSRPVNNGREFCYMDETEIWADDGDGTGFLPVERIAARMMLRAVERYAALSSPPDGGKTDG